MAVDLPAVDARLRTILDVYRYQLDVTREGPEGLALERRGPKTPASYFAGVRRGKRYVSFYLMPVYGRPELLAGATPELVHRMQGKSCFNFTTIDEVLFDELAALTRRSFEAFLAADYPRVPGAGSASASGSSDAASASA